MNVTQVVDDILNKLLDNGFEDEDVLTSERNNLGYLDVLAMDSNCAETYWRIYVNPTEIIFTKTTAFNGIPEIEMLKTFQEETSFLSFLDKQINHTEEE